MARTAGWVRLGERWAWSLQVEGPVALHQLADELVGVLGEEISFSADGDAMHAAPDHPVHVWVDGTTEPTRGVLEAVRAHQPDPDWVPSRPAAGTPTVDEVRAKAARHAMLSPDELQVAIRHLLATSGT